MASQQNQQGISSDEDAICSSTLNSTANFIHQNCLKTDQLQGEFNKKENLNPSLIESEDNSHLYQLANDSEECDKGEGRKRRFMEMERGEEEKRRSLDLNLGLTPLGLHQKDLCGNQSEISSTSSCMPINHSSSSSEEVDELSNTVFEVEANPSLVLMGCSRCLIYVMVSEINPKCPNCKTSFLIDIFRNAFGKKSRKT